MPFNILSSRSQKKPKAKSTRMRSRQRPLQSCGVSILAIADIALGKTQEINGPLGSTLRKIAKLAKFVTPLIYAMQYIWLAILAFIDDRILFAEKITEKLFPPSTYVFDKIDDVVLMIVSLPEKFDVAVNKFPAIIHQVPIVEWSLNIVISRLNSLASTLNKWGEEDSGEVNEKTIGVDKICNNNNNNSAELEKSESTESFPPIPEAENKGVVVHEVVPISSPIKGTYKEVLLEKGKEENHKIEEEWESEKIINEYEEENEEENDENLGSRSESMNDPIVQLFESAWLMKSGRY